MKFFILSINLLLFLLGMSQANYPNKSSLQLKEIMKGNSFIGNQPEDIHWNVNGTDLDFMWNPLNEVGNSFYKIQPLSKDQKAQKISSSYLSIAYDRSQQAYSDQYSIIEGCLVKYAKKDKKISTLIQSTLPIRTVQRVNQPELVYYQQGNNLFQYAASSGSIRQVTNFISGDEKNNKQDSTNLMKQEYELFQYHRDQKAKNNWNENLHSVYNHPEAFYFGKLSLENIQISADSKYVAFRLSNYPSAKETEIQHHISSDGQSYSSPAREKVNDDDASHKLGILNLEKDSTYFIDLSKLSDIRKKPTYLNDPTPYEKDRKVIMHSLHFSKKTSEAVCDIRSYDNKDRWIILINLQDGSFQELDKQHDEAWIGGPGISSWNMEEGTLGWTKDYETIYFQSEETGFSHLYLLNTKTKIKTALTSGKWEVYEALLSNDGKRFFITANKTHPGDRGFYHLDLNTKILLPILEKAGYHEVYMSPDEKSLAVRYSYKNKPWELYYSSNSSGAILKQLTSSTTKEFQDYQWREPEIVTFKGTDGVEVFARLYKPSEATANSTAVIFVHGAGYLQNAHNYWSTYYREYMFHNLMADNGFTILDIDYRASEGYGRDCRTAIYRHMGGQDLQDQLSGKKYLVDNLNIDSDRVGIYGGSYGGFITLMAMLTTPTQFQCGAALRSVTDWAHYNHEYTSNILNYPGSDPEAYKKSSPIYYANGLKNRLLMLHGMVDDNVQFQDVVRLSQRFIELGKENWELAVYPVEAHGFKESYSWQDEYRRIYELFYDELILKHRK
jgi:dipeptidyl aminopeptidase/acylaminoacyl peptidase